MNNTNQNHTDNFFKQGLSSPPELSPSDKNWEAMEGLLKPESTRRTVAWIYPLSGIAAALLIFLSLWLVTKEPAIETQRAEVPKSAEKNMEAGNKTNSNLNSAEAQDIKGQPASSLLNEDHNIRYKPIAATALLGNNEKNNFGKDFRGSADLPMADFRSIVTPLNEARYLNINTSSSGKFASQRTIENSNAPFKAVIPAMDETNEPDARTPSLPGKWALSLALSPDLNSVKGLDKSDFGLSLGMGVSYNVGKTLSVGTGIYYSQKIYSADKTSYKVTEKPFATWTSYSKQIDADCRVLDIPLNLTWRMANKTENKLYATAGLSSYIMLSEKYAFIYNNPSPAFPTGRREYTVNNQNKHILSVVNLGFALEKPLSKQVSLVIQPYAKLPLTGIGQGETDLKSFGLGFRVNYSLKKKN